MRPKQTDRGWNDPPTQLFRGAAGPAAGPAATADKKKKRYVRPPTADAHNLMYGGSNQNSPYGPTPTASPMPAHNAQFQSMGMQQPGEQAAMGYPSPVPAPHAQMGYGNPAGAPGGYGHMAHPQQGQPSQQPNMYGAQAYGAPQAQPAGGFPGQASHPQQQQMYSNHQQAAELHPQAAQSMGYGQYAGYPSSGQAAGAPTQWPQQQHY